MCEEYEYRFWAEREAERRRDEDLRKREAEAERRTQELLERERAEREREPVRA